MKNERRNKRLYKTISCIIVFFICVFAFVALTFSFPQKKVKAGVIIEEDIHFTLTNLTTIYANDTNISSDYYYIGVSQSQINNSNGVQIANICHTQGLTNTAFRVKNFRFDFAGWQGQFQGGGAWNIQGGTPSGFKFVYKPPTTLQDDGIIYLSIQDIFTKIGEIGNNANIWQSNNFTPYLSLYSQAYIKGFYIKESSATLKQAQNIFDVEDNTLTLLYLSDISGLNTSAMRDEIVINWGFIDQSDNTIYAEYSPTISAQNLLSDDKTIRLGLPVNAQGDAMQYYDISQSAILSISGISTGSATATANIYGVYIWKNDNNIKWGLANFNTATTPQSAMSMNYLTSFTELFDYQNVNTATMTCRLNVSNNFNFITIKNQTSVNVDNVNAVIQQGGFLPAWAVYNWARGTYSGFIAGDASARADYAEGKPAYEAIFQAGYKAGFDSAEIGTGAWFITAFNAVDRFLNIHIFPNITFGVLLGIPFVISLAWFIIRMFRGGGGD